MGKAEKTEKAKKTQKHFWKDFKAELKKVIWPTRSQVVNNTLIVIAIVLIITAIVFVLDLAFETLNTYGIDKLKTTVQNSITSEEETDDSETSEEETDNGEGSEELEAEYSEGEEGENTEETPEDITDVDNNLEE